MLNVMKIFHKTPRQQRGVAAVEFAIVATLLFVLLFGIIELGRLIYMFNTVQEVTRRAAREAVVRWIDNSSTSPARNLALFGSPSLPAGAEITGDNIDIEYLKADGVTEVTHPPSSSEGNIAACLAPGGTVDCIAFVRVSITGVTYAPIVSLFTDVEITVFPFSEDEPFKVDLKVPIPASTVIMPAESMGYSR